MSRVIRSGIHFGSRPSHEGLNPSDRAVPRGAARSRASHRHVSDIFNRRIKITDAKVQPQNPLSAGGRGDRPPKVSRVPCPHLTTIARRCVDFKSL